ncbi:MAG: hypothetical protein QOJ78_2287 [Pseudonocardiales bacterium]|nr:hypothetical protein [Pseudonocardiales bacterium]
MRVRAMIALGLASLWLVLVGPASSAVAYPPTTCPTMSISTENPLPGATMTVTGNNFAANASIQLRLDTSSGNVMATLTSSAAGAFSVQVTLPAGLFGRHKFVAVGGDTDATGCPVDPFQVINVQPISASSGAAGAGGGTAFTGFDIMALLVGAAVLIGAGVLFNRRGHASRV